MNLRLERSLAARIDYAYADFGRLEATHWFTVGLEFDVRPSTCDVRRHLLHPKIGDVHVHAVVQPQSYNAIRRKR